MCAETHCFVCSQTAAEIHLRVSAMALYFFLRLKSCARIHCCKSFILQSSDLGLSDVNWVYLFFFLAVPSARMHLLLFVFHIGNCNFFKK